MDVTEKNQTKKCISPIRIRIIANYPRDLVKNKNKQWVERGSLHIRFPINGEDFDVRGIHYCYSRQKAWIIMPSKKGMLDGEPCEYPICNFRRKDPQRGFVGLMQYLFNHFAKSSEYTSLEKSQKKERRRFIQKNMTFIDLPSKKNI